MDQVKVIVCEEIEPKIFEMITKYLSDYNQHLKHTHNQYFIEKRRNLNLNTDGYLISHEIKFLGLAPLVWIHSRKTHLYRTILPYPIGRLKNNEYSFNLDKPCSHNFEWKPDNRLNIKKAKSPIWWLYEIINTGEYEGLMCSKLRIDEIYDKYAELAKLSNLKVYDKKNLVIGINKLKNDGKIMESKVQKIKIKDESGKYTRKSVKVIVSINKEEVMKILEKNFKGCKWTRMS